MKSQIEMAAKSLEISVRSEYLPQTQKTTVLTGLRAGSDSPLKVQLWRSADTVWARADNKDKGGDQRFTADSSGGQLGATTGDKK